MSGSGCYFKMIMDVLIKLQIWVLYSDLKFSDHKYYVIPGTFFCKVCMVFEIIHSEKYIKKCQIVILDTLSMQLLSFSRYCFDVFEITSFFRNRHCVKEYSNNQKNFLIFLNK